MGPYPSTAHVPVHDYNGTPPDLTVYGLDDTYTGSFTYTGGAVTLDVTTRGEGLHGPVHDSEHGLGIELAELAGGGDRDADLDNHGLDHEPGDGSE